LDLPIVLNDQGAFFANAAKFDVIGRCLGVSGPTLAPRIDVEALHLKHLAICVRSGESACRDVYFEARTLTSSANVSRSVIAFGLCSFGNIEIAPLALHLFWYLRLRPGRRDDAGSECQSGRGVDDKTRSHVLRGGAGPSDPIQATTIRKAIAASGSKNQNKAANDGRLAVCHLADSTAVLSLAENMTA
jgi:hypothetical protein